MFNYVELNANVAYLAENIRFLVSNHQIDLDTHLDAAFKICLKCNSDTNLNEVKKNLIFFLLNNHLGCKLLVPCPPLSFKQIVNLAIRNDLDNLLEIFEKFDPQITLDLTNKLVTFILDSIKTQIDEFYKDFILFSIDILFNLRHKRSNLIDSSKLLQVEHYLLTSLTNNQIEFNQTKLNFYFNKILDYIYDILNLNVISHSREQILEFFKLNLEQIQYGIKLIRLITVNSLNGFTISKMSQCFELMSLLKQINDLKDITDFYLFLKQIIQLNYSTQFDDYYIMVNKLIGYEELIEKLIFNKDYSKLDDKDLNVLFSIKDYMSNETNLYILLKMINNLAIVQSDLLNEYVKLFWLVLSNFSVEAKICFISNQIYSKYEIKMNDANELVCLLNSDFNKNLTLMINQLSFENCQDIQILNKLAELMCVSLEKVFFKLVKHALSSKTQIPTLFKLMNKFAILLKCKIRRDSKLNLILDCLKQNLDYIVFNQNDKMLQCYETLIKEMSKSHTKLIDFDEYFSISLENYLDFEQIFQTENGLLISIELFEIIFKCLSSNLVNLVYFLNLLTYMNFNSQNEPRLVNRILNVKEKCLSVIKQLVKYLNYQKPLTKEELNQLKNVSNEIYWPYTSLYYSLTKHMILPSFFKDLNQFNSVTYFNVNDSTIVQCLLELVVVNSDISKLDNIIGDNINCKELQYDIILATFNKTSSELKNLFDFVYSLMGDLNLDIDDEIKELIQTENDKHKNFVKFLKFFYEIFYYLNRKISITYLLNNFNSFIKAYCYNNDSKNVEMNLKMIMFTIYHLLKFFEFIKEEECVEMCRLSVEMLNQAVVLHRDNVKINLKSITSLCQSNLKFINEKYKNYIYLMNQNFESIIQINKIN